MDFNLIGDKELTRSLEMLRNQKLSLIEKGEVTDFSFLVGPEGQEKLMHCFKSDLLVASDYFGALLRNTPEHSLPVRLDYVKPHIFELILEFISVQTLGEITNIEDILAFTFAADHFLIEPLYIICLALIEKITTVENVWHILNSTNTIPRIQSACNKVLLSKTRECLAHPSFFVASKESLIYLLQQDVLNINSEQELIDACLKLAHREPAHVRAELLRAALPHLRLLTMKNTKIKAELLNCLTDNEKLYLLTKLYSEENIDGVEVEMPDILNSKTSPRCKPPSALNIKTPLKIKPGSYIVDIIPDSMLITDPCKMFVKQHNLISSSSFAVYIQTKCSVAISGIDLIAPAKCDPIFFLRQTMSGSNYLEAERVCLSPTVRVFYNSTSRCIYKEKFILGEKCLYSSVHVYFSRQIVVPKNTWVEIQVEYAEKLDFLAVSEVVCQSVIEKAAQQHPFITRVTYDPSHFAGKTSMCFMIKSVHLDVI